MKRASKFIVEEAKRRRKCHGCGRTINAGNTCLKVVTHRPPFGFDKYSYCPDPCGTILLQIERSRLDTLEHELCN